MHDEIWNLQLSIEYLGQTGDLSLWKWTQNKTTESLIVGLFGQKKNAKAL